VWESTDAGATWSNISANIPDAPVWMLTDDQPPQAALCEHRIRRLLPEERQEELGTAGYRTAQRPVLDLKLTGNGNVLYAATFGRGIYQIPVS
jgi:hypothetical protein